MRGYSGTRLRRLVLPEKAFGNACALQPRRVREAGISTADPVARAYTEDGPGRGCGTTSPSSRSAAILRLNRRPDKLVRALQRDLRFACSAQRSIERRQLLPRSGGDQRQAARGPAEQGGRAGGGAGCPPIARQRTHLGVRGLPGRVPCQQPKRAGSLYPNLSRTCAAWRYPSSSMRSKPSASATRSIRLNAKQT